MGPKKEAKIQFAVPSEDRPPRLKKKGILPEEKTQRKGITLGRGGK